MRIDLNADVGESFGRWRLGDDEALLDVVSSANVACGFHAGDPLTMTRTVHLAAARGVRVGAHVSYRDLVGFGRRFVDASPAELVADVVYQIGALAAMCRRFDLRVAYVKPHGALYNTIAHHEGHAAALIDAVLAYDRSLPVVGAPGSVFLRLAAESGLTCVREGFADRGYRADGTLVPRDQPGALLNDPDKVAERVLAMVLDRSVVSVDGGRIPLEIETVCLHGDTDGATELARAVRARLRAEGVRIEAFAP
ncbi:LamB/YcsF family protein [Tessaracoccus sp. HDW20]|uniref:LamB/YcsF family protein n=1 Tax=Tessaracoccus coleopterorum TaxID=2714950 RepID=UPI0018D3115A|nr:5-oxoprolinase subunit PxpA [Tessaracoccus coleopterorum]NHB85581.1 LamB/YcsF family protein [Tessaracoccus coleopterorum]